MAEFEELAAKEREARRIVRHQWFWLHFAVFATIQVFLVLIWAMVSGKDFFPWFVYPLFGWGVFVAAHAVFAFVVRTPEEVMIERERRRERAP